MRRGELPETPAELKPDRLPERLEEQTLERMWRMYERNVVPADVPTDDFGRKIMHDAFFAAASTIVLIWQRLERESEERRKTNLERFRAECDVFALSMAPRSGSPN